MMMVDDEPLMRKLVMMEMNDRSRRIESGDVDGSIMRNIEMVDTFADGPALTAALSAGAVLPDYLLVDMELSGEPTGGLQITRRVHERYPSVRIIIFSGRFDNPPRYGNAVDPEREQRLHDIGRVVMDALTLGASAFVSKNASGGFSVENILRAIACLERGEQFYFNYPVMLTLKEAAERYFNMTAMHDTTIQLSANEHQLLLLEAAGCTASEISSQLGETEKNIQERQKDLSRRLNILNKSGARIAKAISLGLIDTGEVKFLQK